MTEAGDNEKDFKNASAETKSHGPGDVRVGVLGIVLVTSYLATATVLLIYALLVLWPAPTPSREDPGTASATGSGTGQFGQPTVDNGTLVHRRQEPVPVKLLGYTFSIWDEQRLLLLVMFAGALGSLVHALRSVYWYVGNRDLVWSWVAMYLLLPFSGATLGLIFYRRIERHHVNCPCARAGEDRAAVGLARTHHNLGPLEIPPTALEVA